MNSPNPLYLRAVDRLARSRNPILSRSSRLLAEYEESEQHWRWILRAPISEIAHWGWFIEREVRSQNEEVAR